MYNTSESQKVAVVIKGIGDHSVFLYRKLQIYFANFFRDKTDPHSATPNKAQ